MKCPYCNTKNPQKAKFCFNCGKPLRIDIEEELKIASILVLDLKGYSKILSRFGADETAEFIKKLFSVFKGEIEKYKGKVIKLLGDGMICAFGIPISLDDYVDRAILSALSILEKIKEFQKDFPEISIKIAISCGKVWQGFLGGEIDLVGEPINIAVYLQNYCPPNNIITTNEVLSYTSHKFKFEKIGRFNIQKLEKDIDAYLILGKGRGGKKLNQLFIGREKELRQIEEILKNVRDKGVSILIEGEEGVGKSRLIKKIRERLGKKFIWYKGRALSYTSNFSYYPILEIIKDLWDVKNDKEFVEKIDEKIKEIFIGKETIIPLEYYKSFLKNLLFISKDEFWEQWDQNSKEQFLKILLEEIFVHSLKKRKKPIVFIIEDIHWADLSTLKILKDIILIKDLFPISFILTVRKNYKNITKNLPINLLISLSPLNMEESIELLKQMNQDINIEDARKIVEKFGGNPLFLEEISRIIKEKRVLENEEVLKIIPESIQGIIQKRIDSLDYLSKMVLQWTSILGRKFSLKDLLMFSEGKVNIKDIKKTLMKLQRLNFIRRDKDRNFSFHHVLIHNVIYESIPRSKRRKLHITVAENLEREKRNIRDIAYHYSQAEDPRAIDYLFSLANMSFSNSSYEETLNLCEEIENLINKKFEKNEKILKYVYLLKGECYLISGSLDESIKLFEKSLKYVNTKEDYAEILRKIAWCYNRKGELERSLAILEEGVKLTCEKKSKIYGNIIADMAWILYRLDKTDSAINYLKESLEILQEEGDEISISKTYNNLGVILWSIGDLKTSLEYQKKNLELSKRIKDPIKIFTSYNNIGLVYESMGELERAKEYYEEALNLCEKIKYRLGIAHSMCNLGNCYFKLGNLDIAEYYIKKAIETWKSLNIKEWLPLSLIYLSNIKIRKNEINDAEKILEEIKNFSEDIKDLTEEKLCKRNLIYIDFLKRKNIGEPVDDLIEPLLYIWNYLKGKNDIENMADTAVFLAEIYKEIKDVEKFNFFINNALSVYKARNFVKEIERINEIKGEMERIH